MLASPKTRALFCLLACGLPMSNASPMEANLTEGHIKCVWPKKYDHFTIKDVVYNICKKSGAHDGLSNKNAADAVGELAFIFGRIGTHTGPRGLQDYYEGGVIQVVHVAVTYWGAFMQCNHTASGKYHCDFDPSVKPPAHADKVHAGREKNWHSVGYWYSFPEAGRDKHWMQGHGGSEHCGMKLKSAKCVLDHMIKKRGCDIKMCTSKHEKKLWQCADCMKHHGFHKLKKHWDEAVWHTCPDITVTETQMFQDILQ